MIADIKKEMIINFGKNKNRAFGRYLERKGRGDINFLENNHAEIN